MQSNQDKIFTVAYVTTTFFLEVSPSQCLLYISLFLINVLLCLMVHTFVLAKFDHNIFQSILKLMNPGV